MKMERKREENQMLKKIKSLNIIGHFLSGEQSEHTRRHCFHLNLSHRRRQHVHDSVMRHGHHRLMVDLEESVFDSRFLDSVFSLIEQHAIGAPRTNRFLWNL